MHLFGFLHWLHSTAMRRESEAEKKKTQNLWNWGKIVERLQRILTKKYAASYIIRECMRLYL